MSTSHRWSLFTATILAIGLTARTTEVVLAQDKLDRTVLPIQAPTYKAITEVDARKAKAPPRFNVKATGSRQFPGRVTRRCFVSTAL